MLHNIPEETRSQIKYEWHQVTIAKYESGGMLCHVNPNALKALQCSKTSGTIHQMTQFHAPGTYVFHNTATRTSCKFTFIAFKNQIITLQSKNCDQYQLC